MRQRGSDGPAGPEGESLAFTRNISGSRKVLSPTACGRSPLPEGAKRGSIRQLQRIHPPAALGGNEADGFRKRVRRDVGAFPAPTFKRLVIQL